MAVCFETFSLAFEKQLLDQHALVVQLNEFGTRKTLEHSINKNRSLFIGSTSLVTCCYDGF